MEGAKLENQLKAGFIDEKIDGRRHIPHPADYSWEQQQLLGKSRCTRCAEVVRVKRLRDGKIVAIRKISSPLLAEPKDAAEAFEELKRLVNLPHHRNLVKINAMFHRQGMLCLETDYLEVTLNQMIQRNFELRRAFSQSQLVSFMLQLVQALRYLHANNILHRDIRPKNIYILKQDDTVLKLGDYGAPKIYQNRSHGSRFAGAFWWADNRYNAGPQHCCLSPVNAWPYMPPEMMCEMNRPKTALCTHVKDSQGDRYTTQSEAWSVGVVLYEMLTLRVPFQGRTPKQVQKSIKNANLPLSEIPTIRKYHQKLSSLAIGLLHDVPGDRWNLEKAEQELNFLHQRASIFTLARQGETDQLEALLDSGSKFDLNVRNSQGYTPVMIAAALGNVDTMQALLKRGAASVGVRSRHGCSLEDCIDYYAGDDKDLQFALHETLNATRMK